MTDLELLSKRLAKLEQRFRWMKRTAVIVGILVSAAAVMAQVRGVPGEVLPRRDEPSEFPRRPERAAATSPVEMEVRSRHFVLVDDKGKERASLVADGAGSVFLVMFDNAGKTRTNLSVSNDGPSLMFYDAAGQHRTILGSTTLVGSHVNENGIAEKAPPSSIILFDKGGKLLWREP